MVAADLSVYAFFYAWTMPAGLVSGTSLLTCRITTSPTYCPSNITRPSYCEPVQGSVAGCYIIQGAGIVAPNPPPPPPPSPPTPGQCSSSGNNLVSLRTASEFVTGRYFSAAAVGADYATTGASAAYPACNRGTGNGVIYPPCRYGGLQCTDSTVYAMYYPWNIPSDAISGQSMVS